MAGLVSYGSSDEEDTFDKDSTELEVQENSVIPSSNGIKAATFGTNGEVKSSHGSLPEADAPLVGPALGPIRDIPEDLELGEDQTMTPQSPYSTNQALLRDLSLPSIPNYDIPPSPLGSPMESTNAKFKHFLELKKQGIHFNEKLSKSSAVKNPSLMQKLMDFSDIDETGQYSTALPKELWDHAAFPESAYKEQLLASQQKILRKREDEKARGQRESVDFVPASTSSESSGRGGTPGLGGRSGQRSAAERVMAGLDKGRSSSPHVQGLKRKSRFDS